MSGISKEQIVIDKAIKKMVNAITIPRKMGNFKVFHSNKVRKIHEKTLIVTIGPPARGKSFLGNYIKNNNPKHTRIFNAGSKRREKGYAKVSAKFFETKKGKGLLNEWAMETLEEGCEWLQKRGNNCAIFDATNSTVKRRRDIYEITKKYAKNISVIYVEMLCPNPLIVHYNMLMKVLTSPDYKTTIQKKIKDNVNMERAIFNSLKDIKKRDNNYLKRYVILNKKEKEQYHYIQFIIPFCTMPPSDGVIDTNIRTTTWLIKQITGLPEKIMEQTIRGYTSYKK